MLLRLSSDFSVDATEYASRANAVLGIRDSGKTFTATLIAEQLFEAGIPFFAFDPIGRWRFLRYPDTGVRGSPGKGFPVVVAGGAAPDLPLTPESAPELIRAAMRAGVSMVLDLYSIALSKSDWRKIVRSSIETILYESEGHGLRHVFLEEAAEFIPQHVRDGQTYAAVEKLARMGGNVGVGVTLINQRAEEVNKAVLELCDNLLLHRQRGKNSLISLRKWLDAGNIKPPKEITDSLADLPTGQCWAWFKDVGRPKLIKIARKKSFDPNRREMTKTKAVISTHIVDVSAFVERMKAALAGKPVEPVTKPKTPDWQAKAWADSKPAVVAEDAIGPMEGQVNEKEAAALRAEIARQQKEIARLREGQRSIERGTSFDPAILDMDAVFAELKRRAADDPSLIAVLARVPEITVTEERAVIRMDSKTQPGFLAVLIAHGFFDQPVMNAVVKAELKRRGRSVHDANLSRDLNRLAEQGFLTKEDGGFCAAPGMKVNIEKAA